MRHLKPSESIRLFPFLIGKVLTGEEWDGWAWSSSQTMFPFLIGKVLTTAFKPL